MKRDQSLKKKTHTLKCRWKHKTSSKEYFLQTSHIFLGVLLVSRCSINQVINMKYGATCKV